MHYLHVGAILTLLISILAVEVGISNNVSIPYGGFFAVLISVSLMYFFGMILEDIDKKQEEDKS